MTTKTISMSCLENSSSVHMSVTYDEGTPWHAIAYQFYSFLLAQGYSLPQEAVSADCEAYARNTDQLED